MPPTFLPYCGSPPDPAALWTRWNLDPLLLAALLVVAGAHALAQATAVRAGPRPGGSPWFYAGWTIIALALVSPLCALSVSLFSARVAQHLLIALVAAPMLAASRPVRAVAAALGPPVLAAGAFAVALWLWHLPGPYDATFRSNALYWLMHVSLGATAIWLWTALLDRRPDRVVAGALLSLATSIQMGLLGALLTFAPRPILAPHAATAAAWGLSPLQDQQLGGMLMWIPGGLVFLAVTLSVLHGLVAEPRPAALRR